MHGIAWEVAPGDHGPEIPSRIVIANGVGAVLRKSGRYRLFGHTHVPLVETHQGHKGILMMNPGSLTLPRQVRRLGAVAILEPTPENREGHILDLTQF